MDILEKSMRDAKGNVPQELRDLNVKWWRASRATQVFAKPICSRLEVTEALIFENNDTPGRKEGRLVFEIVVTRDMCNYLSDMHGGCAATLIDFCTSLVRNLVLTKDSPTWNGHVSLTLNVTFHAPAVLGTRLKIVNSTVAIGTRVITARAEIYDVTNGRIVASGMHVKVPPSQPKL
ncbi:uncharacterized protein PHACADRAFT_261738, partial [Phanerochaete carnosa HHB-10118-sp]